MVSRSRKFLALVTSYNDKNATLNCIRALLKQTMIPDYILVIDNSPFDSELEQNLNECEIKLTNLVIQWHPENLGIAAALRIGFQCALMNQMTHMWTFDQDSAPAPNALQLLSQTIESEDWSNHNGLFASIPFDEGTGRYLWGYRFVGFKFEELESEPGAPFYTCDGTITAGTLIPVNPHTENLLPDSRLFIDGVDHALCLNFLQEYGQVVIVRSSEIIHHLGSPSIGINKFSKTKRLVHNYSPLRKFYIARNHTYLELRSAKRSKQIMIATLWRFRVAANMIREALHENPRALFPSACSIFIGTMLGFVGKMIGYQKLPRFMRQI